MPFVQSPAPLSVFSMFSCMHLAYKLNCIIVMSMLSITLQPVSVYVGYIYMCAYIYIFAYVCAYVFLFVYIYVCICMFIYYDNVTIYLVFQHMGGPRDSGYFYS